MPDPTPRACVVGSGCARVVPGAGDSSRHWLTLFSFPQSDSLRNKILSLLQGKKLRLREGKWFCLDPIARAHWNQSLQPWGSGLLGEEAGSPFLYCSPEWRPESLRAVPGSSTFWSRIVCIPQTPGLPGQM